MAKDVWTERKVKVLRELYPRAEVAVTDIASRLGVSPAAVCAKAYQLSLPPRNSGRKAKRA